MAELTAGVVVHAGLGQHGVVLDLGLADGRAVVGDDDELGCRTKPQNCFSHKPKAETFSSCILQPLLC